jgi:hypothetical protein
VDSAAGRDRPMEEWEREWALRRSRPEQREKGRTERRSLRLRDHEWAASQLSLDIRDGRRGVRLG